MNRWSRAATKIHVPECSANVEGLVAGSRHARRRRPCAGGGRYRHLPQFHGGTRSAPGGLRERVADEKITGPSRAAAFWYRGDSLVKKRDYDGAIAAFTASHEIAPQNVNVINARGIAYSYKGDDERALADYDLCLQLRPTYGSAYNNRGLIFMRRGSSMSSTWRSSISPTTRAATCIITTGAASKA
jgi:tetratricopeptide (TPR) repeat protein